MAVAALDLEASHNDAQPMSVPARPCCCVTLDKTGTNMCVVSHLRHRATVGPPRKADTQS